MTHNCANLGRMQSNEEVEKDSYDANSYCDVISYRIKLRLVSFWCAMDDLSLGIFKMDLTQCFQPLDE